MKNDSSYVLLAILIVLLAGFFYDYSLTGEQIYTVPQTNYEFLNPTFTQLVSDLNESGLRLTTGSCPIGYSSAGSAVVRDIWAAKKFNPQNQIDYDYLGYYTGEGDIYFCIPSGSGALLLSNTSSCPSGYAYIGNISQTGAQLFAQGKTTHLCSNLTAGNPQVKLMSIPYTYPVTTCSSGYYSSGILGSGGFYPTTLYGTLGAAAVSYNQVCAMRYNTIGTSPIVTPPTTNATNVTTTAIPSGETLTPKISPGVSETPLPNPNPPDTLAPTSVLLINPANGIANLSNSHVFFSSARDDRQLANATLYHDIVGSFAAVQTIPKPGGINSVQFTVANIPNGTYVWNVRWCDTSKNCAFAPSNYVFTVGNTTPGIPTTSTTPPGTLPGPVISTGGGGGGGGRKVGAGALICGNKRLDFGEECDDGNIFNDDGCTNDCKIEYCGDGVIQYGAKEECDPPDEITCALGCTLIAEKPSIPIAKPAVQEPVYQPPVVPVYESEKESKLGKAAKIGGIIIAVAALGSLVTWVIRKKFKRQQQPYVLPVRYSRGSK